MRRRIGRRAQNGWTALIYTAAQGHAECARLLLDAGADTEAKDRTVCVMRLVACWALWSWDGGGFVRREACHLHLCVQFSFLTFLCNGFFAV